MTRKAGNGLSATLATATCTLLGTAALTPVRAQEAGDWALESALLYYGEGDGRVQDGDGPTLHEGREGVAGRAAEEGGAIGVSGF